MGPREVDDMGDRFGRGAVEPSDAMKHSAAHTE